MGRCEVYGPDGRPWQLSRKRSSGGLLGRRGGSRWVVEATTAGPPAESRHWYAERRAAAKELLQVVAMALRTGTEGPLQPED